MVPAAIGAPILREVPRIFESVCTKKSDAGGVRKRAGLDARERKRKENEGRKRVMEEEGDGGSVGTGALLPFVVLPSLEAFHGWNYHAFLDMQCHNTAGANFLDFVHTRFLSFQVESSVVSTISLGSVCRSRCVLSILMSLYASRGFEFGLVGSGSF